MPDTPEEDGTTGTQEVPSSVSRSDWQLRFENVIAMVAPTTLHIPTDNSEIYSSHPYGDLQTYRTIASKVWSVYSVYVQNGRVRGWFVGSLDKPAQVGWRLKMLLWEFAEAIGEIGRNCNLKPLSNECIAFEVSQVTFDLERIERYESAVFVMDSVLKFWPFVLESLVGNTLWVAVVGDIRLGKGREDGNLGL
ncbi:hypothetical protein BU17DRAFT_102796 [Hysterangium stoloniferum]|nr:hypothetical protein BU17DRAFT_102796 [Hysterangium stoloniferum]